MTVSSGRNGVRKVAVALAMGGGLVLLPVGMAQADTSVSTNAGSVAQRVTSDVAHVATEGAEGLLSPDDAAGGKGGAAKGKGHPSDAHGKGKAGDGHGKGRGKGKGGDGHGKGSGGKGGDKRS
ncbi:hypothetical protein [Streptantibioticus cattleyicolor]|uniref:Uncharacterized protein n=1 Tax=Streptantibioticus cattleyicolor (strain ATCC 35852 / DSM 46488 / JCM 4925 / NBRC 14057 / NRRL 8057) TaxID=1003195 RepID=F8JMA7_STREN|nr:hypothetical protein [Streptantibioticus cattleyicolor]AEW99393.1 hypothetical protein SCATT_p12000 [Streptantibioticus cattleyicolor NRRL 8057 = DSM 46488]CCB71565.1 exported protein of unknown function [Streptantibioticus cattleyicolor NRRL 8057 = DSM 46488]